MSTTFLGPALEIRVRELIKNNLYFISSLCIFFGAEIRFPGF